MSFLYLYEGRIPLKNHNQTMHERRLYVYNNVPEQIMKHGKQNCMYTRSDMPAGYRFYQNEIFIGIRKKWEGRLIFYEGTYDQWKQT